MIIHNIKLGFLTGIMITLFMKFIPIFHGYDSNDVRRVVFTDDKGKHYKLQPEEVKYSNWYG